MRLRLRSIRQPNNNNKIIYIMESGPNANEETMSSDSVLTLFVPFAVNDSVHALI